MIPTAKAELIPSQEPGVLLGGGGRGQKNLYVTLQDCSYFLSFRCRYIFQRPKRTYQGKAWKLYSIQVQVIVRYCSMPSIYANLN